MADILVQPDISHIERLPIETLAAVIDQSTDCVKLIGLDQRLRYMNANGQCAMEVDDICAIVGQPWTSLWPAATHDQLADAIAAADVGRVSRFDAYCPTAKGTPRWWNVSVSPIRAGDGSVSGYVSISRDITEAELGRQALETITAEMRHRLKNSYAMIGSLLASYSRGDPDRETLASEMIERLSALGTAQTLFAARDHAPCRLSELIPALVETFDMPRCPVALEPLPDAVVDQGQADAIALVFGELAVNSTKHGALGAGGTIAVSATQTDDRLRIVWRERSERPVLAQARVGGQGLKLMERVVRVRRGQLNTTWHKDGLDVEIDFARV